MTSKPDLGVILAAAGGALALGAVIAGFLIVGGPGDARAERFDDMVAQEMQDTAYSAQCAYWVSGAAQASMTQVESVLESERVKADALGCADRDSTNTGRVDYSAIDGKHIRLCGDFRRPSYPANDFKDGWRTDYFPELNVARAKAGSHCFDIKLLPADESPAKPKPY